MRSSIIVIVISFTFTGLLFAKTAHSQLAASHISIKIEKEKLQASLEKIEKLSQVKFAYNSAELQGCSTTARHYKNAAIGDILADILAGTKLTYKEINNNIVIFTNKDKATAPATTTPSPAENSSVVVANISIKGTVIDAAGPIPGATVTVAGTKKVTATDINGNFTLTDVDPNATLVISSVGYTPQSIKLNGQTTIRITLSQELKSLNEIVVVGYGTQKRSDITGSIASVSSQALKDVPSANLVQALQGQAAGVDIQKSGGNSHPGAVPSITIRGTRSKQASNDPLVVVDGIPFTGSLQDINVDDINSVEVLKDASSTAIYGSRGANGVVLVTTKRGKSGDPVVTYSGYAGFSKVLRQYNVMNAEQYTQLKKWAFYNAAAAKPLYTSPDDPRIITEGAFGAQEQASLKMGRSTNWQDLIYKNGFQTDHQLGVSGGTDKTQYDIAAGYYDETGIYPGQSFARYSLKLSVDQKLGKYIKIGLSSLNNLSYINGENANPLGQALRASPLATPYDDVTGVLVGYVDGSAKQVWNPLANFVPGASVETRKRLGSFNSAYLEAKLAPGLTYRFNGGAEVRTETYGNFYAAATYNNQGSQSTANNKNSYLYNYTLENILNYEHTFARDHHINFTGLYSLQENQNQSTSFSYNNLLSDGVQYFNPAVGSNLTGTGSYAKYDLISYMGRLNYGYKDKYLLTLTARSDGSSKLTPGRNYHFFPSAAFAWNVMQEEFMKNNNILSNLKLRFSFGDVGNAAIDPYQTQGGLSTVTYNYGGKNTIGAYPSNVPNNGLDWEYTRTLNVGVDFGILRDRITGSIDAYHEYTRNLLLPESLPPTSGIPNTVLTNVGRSENVGLEININSNNITPGNNQGFSWSTNLNINFNRGKLTALANGTTVDINNNLFVGSPISAIYDYKKMGIWQNTPADTALAKKYGLTLTGGQSVIGTIRVADLNGDGKLDANDRMIVGSEQPLFSGGITNRFGYKGFDLTVVAAYRVGGTLTSAIYQSGSFLNTLQGNYNNLAIDYWTPYNHQNYWPKPTNAFTNTPYSSLLSYFSGTYLKIRSISLGYNVPKKWLTGIGGHSLKVYATVQNPFILFSPYVNNFNGIDPESSGKLAEDTPAKYSFLFGLNLTL
ncbi:TonB-dependent receptor [Mucilaginibacter yixingensis]|nr:TonB-dependent receptor [Mucilaginibacter yixingensis]